ncbi:hypothetical protein ACLQ3C_10940 [Gordonia sp. DT30]|uniref:hypothetical protein n=1 Tax=unclassified Gordonia (in: high G+C Gram-positive bacteria) TaxID=2657482 RepID=UPI003CEC0E2A
MPEPSETLVVLRDRAVAGVEDLISVLSVGRVVGVAVPADDEVRSVLARIGRFDVSGLSADARRLATAHRVVADQMHRLPEQQVRLDRGWQSGAGALAVSLVIDHQRRAEGDLSVLRSVADATNAAAGGIDQILRTWYLTLARLSTPLVAGIALPEIPAAVLSGHTPPALIAADITSRIGLLTTTAHETQRGIEAILGVLNRSADDENLWSRSRQSDPAGGRARPDGRETPLEEKPTAGAVGAEPDAAEVKPGAVEVRPGAVEAEPGAVGDVPFTLATEEAGVTAPAPQSPQAPSQAPRSQAPTSDLALAGEQ